MKAQSYVQGFLPWFGRYNAPPGCAFIYSTGRGGDAGSASSAPSISLSLPLRPQGNQVQNMNSPDGFQTSRCWAGPARRLLRRARNNGLGNRLRASRSRKKRSGFNYTIRSPFQCSPYRRCPSERRGERPGQFTNSLPAEAPPVSWPTVAGIVRLPSSPNLGVNVPGTRVVAPAPHQPRKAVGSSQVRHPTVQCRSGQARRLLAGAATV